MIRNVSVIIAAVMVFSAFEASSIELMAPLSLEAGGRFDYEIKIARSGNGFPWNYVSGTALDRTRMMLDLRVGEESFGELYLKGAALQGTSGDLSGKKRFEFEQGDYSWKRETDKSRIRFWLFANERRFFTHALIAPLLDDDLVKGSGENRGSRFDYARSERFNVTALYSYLGGEFENSSRIAYLRTAFAHNSFGISTAYLHQNQPKDYLPDLAVFKTEFTACYKKASFICSYEQSGFDHGLFFPSIRFHPDNFVGDNFSRVLPDEGALFAEARLVSLPIKKWGHASYVHRYFTVGKSFAGEVAGISSGSTGYTSGIYFSAGEVALNGRIVYTKQVRSKMENETHEKLEASVWTGLNSGSEIFLRGGIGKTSDTQPFVTRGNFIHTAWRYRLKNLQSGAHLMLKDLDTIFSEQRFAWESRFAFKRNTAVYWRAILSKKATTFDAVFIRFEFRPSRRLFLTVSYGNSLLGDDPYILEDPDISVIGADKSVYGFSIRGDF